MFESLNARQSEAVKKTDGPLVVISGAGTGKTHVLTNKILYLLQEKNIAASQVLALTFTEKAALEIAGRVESALPLGHEEIWIKTFHGLCDSILRERAHEIGLSFDYKIFETPDLWGFVKNHLSDFKLSLYRPLGNPERFLQAIHEYFSRLQDEDIKPEAYLDFAAQAKKKASSEEDHEYAARHSELAHAYAIYLELLTKNAVLDFGSLIYFTLRLFENRPSVLKEFQQRFRYILVDEFQDTNFAQNKIVTLLARHHQNLTVVGDDDQSIYKWRGASLTNIEYFEKFFPSTSLVVLNENYRNSQAILDLAYKIIQKNNPNRLEVKASVDKRLIAAPKPSPAQSKQTPLPEIHHFSTIQEEIPFIAKSAARLQNKAQDVAILVRTNSLALPFIQYFEKNAIHMQHFSPSLLFSKEAVKDCMALLRVISDPWDDLGLFRFLSLPFWKIRMEELLKNIKEAKKTSSPLFDFINDKREVAPSGHYSVASLRFGLFQKPVEILTSLIEFARTESVSQILGKFFLESGYRDYIASLENPDHAEDLARFSERIKIFEESHEEKGVRDFLSYASLLEEAGEGRANASLDPAAIKILTIHGSKGLEFDAVFIPGLVQGKFPTIRRRDPFEIPEALIPEPLPEGDHHVEEERRLFYVALTRAKSILHLSYSDNYDGKKQWKPSVFILEALESGKAIFRTGRPSKKGTIHKQKELDFSSQPEQKEQKLVLNLPKLSYSQLDTFRTCPLKYQFRYLFQVPTEMPFQVHFGTSVHNTLRDFYAYIQEHPDEIDHELFPLMEDCYKKNWIPRGYPSRKLEQDQKKTGFQMLERFYALHKKSPIIPVFLEKSFMLDLGEVKLSGRIDRIDKLSDGTFEIIDYKTGSSSEKNMKKDLQLSIYALACRDNLKIPVSKLSLYYLDNLEKVSTSRSEKDIDKCREEILDYAKELAGSDFSPTPGFHCRYCDFRLICKAAAPMAA